MNTGNKISSHKKILFIHHSTGANLIKEGKVRTEIEKLEPTLEFWDHSYNLYPYLSRLLAKFTYHTGLTDFKGRITGRDFNVVLSNNSPREYAEIFSRDSHDPTLQKILDFDVIVFKNCYPTTKIISDQQLEEDERFYVQIRDSIAKYKDKKFVLLTPPPCNETISNIENAARAKLLVEWLRSEEFLKNAKNLTVFDFFSYLANERGLLKKKYCRSILIDSHPNRKANQEIAPIFANYLTKIALS
ncbi:MAG: hypothetical protein ABI425_06140 [Patescibacteria group bacterium]